MTKPKPTSGTQRTTNLPQPGPTPQRPAFLVLITHANGADIWSAHYTREKAELMESRVRNLAKASGSKTLLLEVPERDGVVESQGVPVPDTPAPVPTQAPRPIPYSDIPPEEMPPDMNGVDNGQVDNYGDEDGDSYGRWV